MSLSGTLDLELDGALRFAFTVTNVGEDPAELQFRDGQRADFVLYEDGGERWRWSDGRLFTQVLDSERLEPGESVTYEGEWEYPESGEYAARATLSDTNHDCVAERGFELSGETLSFDPP